MSERPSEMYKIFKHDNVEEKTPQSTTHETLEMGRKMAFQRTFPHRKLISFQTYSHNSSYFGDIRPIKTDFVTSDYREHFVPHLPVTCPFKPVDDSPHFLWNRKMKSDFEMKVTARTKFMDDAWWMSSEDRKIADFFKQLRNKSRVFEVTLQ